jgi:cell division protein FtsN
MFEVFGALAWGFVGFILFLLWLGVILLVVRFLLIGTRAAKHYLRVNGQHEGVLPQPKPSAPSAPAAAPRTTTTPPAPAAVAKPAPKPRTPKAP